MFRTIKFAIILIIFMHVLSAKGNSELFKSLAVPGWGELEMGNDSRAKTFITSEILVLTSYVLSSKLSDMYIDRYTAFGNMHANLDISNKDYEFIVNMSNYDSMTEYNEDMMRYHNSNYFNDIYENNEGNNWQWDSSQNRKRFNDMRINSEIAKKFSEFAVAGLIINRIASAIDIVYLKQNNSNIQMDAHLIPDSYNGASLKLSFSLR